MARQVVSSLDCQAKERGFTSRTLAHHDFLTRGWPDPVSILVLEGGRLGSKATGKETNFEVRRKKGRGIQA